MTDDGLKDFQRRTVDYVSRRMLDDGVRRFLVADEVGLGKTLVARGVVARTVERLRRDGVRRIDVVYICSNQEIAKQNLKRLQLDDLEATALPSRITLLPLHLAHLRTDGVNMVSFTPGTSFDPRSRGGWTQERALLLCLLTPVWSLPRHKGVFEFFRLNARRAALETELQRMGEPDPEIQRRFASAMADDPLREQVEELIAAGRHGVLRGCDRERQLTVIGDLRHALARVCVDSLEPDLVILDEFQRFAELLDGESDAAELARQLFAFENDRGEFARVLLLSATPYRSFSQTGDEDLSHHAELHRLLRFLFDDEERAAEVQHELRTLREELLTGAPDAERLVAGRQRIEASLTSVIARTERLASSATRNGMLVERAPQALALQADDVQEWADLIALHRLLRERGVLKSSAAVTEFWKSAPWLAQFMDGYAFKHAIDEVVDEAGDDGSDPPLEAALAAVRGRLDWKRFRRYGELAPANARMRALRHDTVDQTWDLLWLPPSLPYYAPGPPFDRLADAAVTKRLVFSSWGVVPRVIAAYLSYEAERRVHGVDGTTAENTQRSRKQHERRLLDFKLDPDGRPSSMANFGLLAPSVTLAELGGLRAVAEAPATTDAIPSAAAVLELVQGRVRTALDGLEVAPDDERVGVDQRWYWAAPLLLDRAREDAVGFWDRWDLTSAWTEGHVGGSENFAQHIAEARAVFEDGIALGQKPDDLVAVLADLALAAPAVVATRGLRGVLPAAATRDVLMDAARLAWGFRHLFNAPEAIAIVEGTQEGSGYWRQTLRYARHGNLQAVVDEWLHVVADDAGAGRKPDRQVLAEVVDRLLQALTLGASRVEVDPVDGREKVAWRTHFAVRYGQAKDDGATQSVHPEAVRRAFNSPLRPFVLATTSVGQEGLDFHTYCHAVVHWNLPSNPVDLEQREGRVHRYKGHAVRRNVAEAFGAVALRGAVPDPWAAAFAAAAAARDEGETDMVPYWVQNGSAQIERHVPALPYSKDAERFARVRRQVTLYRMTFGQPRQDDLIAYLQEQVGQAEAERLAELVGIDLSPRASEIVLAPKTLRSSASNDARPPASASSLTCTSTPPPS